MYTCKGKRERECVRGIVEMSVQNEGRESIRESGRERVCVASMYLRVLSPFVVFCFANSMMSSSVRDRMTSSSVVSTTENATEP